MSSPTFLMVRWTSASSAGRTPSPSTRLSASAQMRSKKRLQPLMEEVFQGAAFSKSPMNISYRRSVSAPYSFTTSSGLTTLPRDFDILTMGCSAISPCFSTRAARAAFSLPCSASRRLRSASGRFSHA